MCQLIVCKDGVAPSDDVLEDCWSANSHGGGLLAMNEGKPAKVFRSMNYKPFSKAVRAASGKYKVLILHFRLASHGARDLQNTHPFFIYEHDAYLFHNGCCTIRQFGDRSDSHAVARMLGRLAEDPLSACKILESLFTPSRFVLAAGFGTQYTIVNEHLGHYEGNAWFSNDSHNTAFYFKEATTEFTGSFKTTYKSGFKYLWED